MNRHLTPTAAEERDRRIHAVIDDCLVQRSTGHSITDAALIARHPELMPELDEQLKRIRLIAGARQRVDGVHRWDAAANGNDDGAAAISIRLQCPHCQAAILLSAEESWSKVSCQACGHELKLVNDQGCASRLRPGSRVGRFELLDSIGSGGFGVVWKAHDPQLDRVVALKVPRRGELTDGEAEFFFREARAAAQVRHPNIVSIHEVGRDGDTVYLVSDFVDGSPLSECVKEQRLTTREAATLCRQVALALSHIHERGIVHRDLKPANVIVTRDDAGGLQPHLTDFGLARRATSEVTMTIDGQLMGTPAYMSPEQASGGGHAAGPATDIYSLGVILFELLTGDPPFRGAPTMVIDQVLHDEPVSPRRLNAYVARDLETIALKCLEKDPGRRYGTARALADDLDRWLRGEPIVARPLGHLARTHRWCRRHPAAAIVAIVFGIGGPMVGVAMTALAWRASTARLTSEAAEQRTRQVLYASTMRNVQTAVEQDDHLRAELLLLGLRPAPDQQDLRSFDWYYWWRQSHAGLVASVPHPPMDIVDSAEITNLRRVAAGLLPKDVNSQDDLKPNNLSLNQPSRRPWLINKQLQDNHLHNDQVSDAAISADGRLLATCGRDGTVQLWDPNTRARPATLYAKPDCTFECVDISPRCTFVAASATHFQPDRMPGTCEVYIWNVGDGQIHRRADIFRIQCRDLAFSPDEQELAVVGGTAPILINVENRTQRTLESPGLEVTDCVYSPDGRQMAGLALGKNVVWLWDLATGKVRRTLAPHKDTSAAWFYPTAQHVVSVGTDSLKLWSISDDSEARLLTEPEPLRRLTFTGDGSRIVTETTYRRMGSIWDLQECQRIHEIGPDLRNLSCSPDANVIAASIENDVVLYSAISGEQIRTLQAHTRRVSACEIGKSGALVASGDGYPPEQSGTADAILWDAKSGRLLHRMPGHFGSISLAIAPDERTLVTADREHILRIWDVETGKLRLMSKSLGQEWSTWGVGRLVFSRNGQALYACSGSAVQVIDPVTGTLLRKLADGTSSITDLCVAPDGKTLAVAREASHVHDEGVVELWDLASGELKTSLGKEHGAAICVAFSPDGRTLASGQRSGKIVRWEAATEEDVRRQIP